MNQSNSQIPDVRYYRDFHCRDAYTVSYGNYNAEASHHLSCSPGNEQGTTLNGGSHYISTYVKIQQNKKVRISIFVSDICLYSVTYDTTHGLDTLEKAVDKAIEILSSIFKHILFEVDKL